MLLLIRLLIENRLRISMQNNHFIDRKIYKVLKHLEIFFAKNYYNISSRKLSIEFIRSDLKELKVEKIQSHNFSKQWHFEDMSVHAIFEESGQLIYQYYSIFTLYSLVYTVVEAFNLWKCSKLNKVTTWCRIDKLLEGAREGWREHRELLSKVRIKIVDCVSRGVDGWPHFTVKHKHCRCMFLFWWGHFLKLCLSIANTSTDGCLVNIS